MVQQHALLLLLLLLLLLSSSCVHHAMVAENLPVSNAFTSVCTCLGCTAG
jgi:hypothetical protein